MLSRLTSSLLLVLLLLGFGPIAAFADTPTPSPAPSPAPSTGSEPVLLVGTSGLRWDDVSETKTPHLWPLLTKGSQAAMTIRNVRTAACPIDGWLAISAGARAADSPREDPGSLCRAVETPTKDAQGALTVPRWAEITAFAASGKFGATPGLFARELQDGKVSYAGIGPGSAIALASENGVMEGSYLPRPDATADLTRATASLLADHRLVVVDVGAIRDPENLTETDAERNSPPRAEQVAEIDRRVGAVLAAAPAKARNGTVAVASLADSGVTPHLQVLSLRGRTPAGSATPEYGPHLLGASSTRQDGLAQVTDLMPTLMYLLGLNPPDNLPGAAIVPMTHTPTSVEGRQRALLDLDEAAVGVQRLVPPFFNGLVIAQILLYGAGTIALRRQWGGIEGRRRVLAVLRRVAIVFAAVPVSTFLANLIPWWRTNNQLLTIVLAVSAGTAVIATAALLGPWRDRRLGPLGFIGGVISGVLALDVATGSRLQISSLMGLQPLVGGRFYGLGNVEFALFASGALMLACSLADAALKRGRKRLAVATVVVIGVVAVVIDGTPGLGSDFGGPPAMIPAFLLMALLVAGVRITWQRLLLIGGATGVIVYLICLLDWLRPASERTHLGRFVQTVIEGGALPVIERKALQNWDILTSSFLTLLVPFGAVFIAVILMRPVAWGAPALQRTYEAAPTLKHGLIALCVLLAIGFAVNDSGTVVPAIGAVLVIPLLIAASVRTLEMADQEEAAAVSGQPELA